MSYMKQMSHVETSECRECSNNCVRDLDKGFYYRNNNFNV